MFIKIGWIFLYKRFSIGPIKKSLVRLLIS